MMQTKTVGNLLASVAYVLAAFAAFVFVAGASPAATADEGAAASGGKSELAANPTMQAGEAGRDALRLFDDGLASFRSGPFTMAVRGRLQAWAGWTGDDALLSNGDPMQEPGFRLRRVRLGVSGSFVEQVRYDIMMNIVDSEREAGSLERAAVDWTPISFIGLTVGVQGYPFLKSQLMSSAYLPHLDRPEGAVAIAPRNAMGATLHSEPWGDKLDIRLGVFNGMRRQSNFMAGYEEAGITLGNRFEGQSYGGRITLMPFGAVGPGMADLFGAESGRFLLAVGGGGFYSDGGSVTTFAYGADLHIKAYGFHLFAEFAQEHSEPKEEPETTETILGAVDRRVVNASLGYVFLPNLLGLAARFELIDDNLDTDNEGDMWVAAGTLSFYGMGDHLKAQLEYAHREEMHGASLGNDSLIAGVQLFF